MHFDCLNSSTSCNKSFFEHIYSRTKCREKELMMKETSNKGRSPLERERTKMRERQRRSITTNIFHGLRKHGGYRLSPRADINEVLRHLAEEAGWTVDPDGTTYRSASTRGIPCPLCMGGRMTAPATPSCSFLGGGGGECSTTADVVATEDTLLAIYMSGAAAPQNGGGGEGQQQLYLVHTSSESPPAGSP